MRRFTRLFTEIDETSRTSRKVEAMERYLQTTPAEDAAWALFFLTGQKLKTRLRAALLRQWVSHLTGYPPWLVDECHAAAGDLAETLALLLPEYSDPARWANPPPRVQAGPQPQLSLGLTPDTSAPDGPRQPIGQSPEGGATSPEVGTAPLGSPGEGLPLHRVVERSILSLIGQEESVQFAIVSNTWIQLDRVERLVYNKLITGGFRVGVGRALVIRALAQAMNCDSNRIAHRLMRPWQPSAEAFRALVDPGSDPASERGCPYPFFLASPLPLGVDPARALAEADDSGEADPAVWLAEWKWDGIRAQLIRRGGMISLWSRGGEFVTGSFPEIAQAAQRLPDGTVLDGEILAWQDDRPLPFESLQRRIGRKNPSPARMAQTPTLFQAFDCLESNGRDIRSEPQDLRRQILDTLLRDSPAGAIRISPLIPFDSWAELSGLHAESRQRGVEGCMLKHREALYQAGRVQGGWWKWKTSPLTADAVLIQAEAGHGRRAGLFTNYTFALWNEGELVPVAKAYSGLTDAEIRRLDRFIRTHTLARHGPVRVVEPIQVFELGFDKIQRSTRHKSGIAVRFPRILRWRTDKNAVDADSIGPIRDQLAREASQRRPEDSEADQLSLPSSPMAP